MKTFTVLTAVTAVLSGTLTLAAPSRKRDDVPQGVIKLPIQRVQTNTTVDRARKNGRGYVEPLKNEVWYYQAEVEVGTPGQSAKTIIDTGSSDLWVDARAYDNNGFVTSQSSTYKGR